MWRWRWRWRWRGCSGGASSYDHHTESRGEGQGSSGGGGGQSKEAISSGKSANSAANTSSETTGAKSAKSAAKSASKATCSSTGTAIDTAIDTAGPRARRAAPLNGSESHGGPRRPWFATACVVARAGGKCQGDGLGQKEMKAVRAWSTETDLRRDERRETRAGAAPYTLSRSLREPGRGVT